MIRLVSGYVCVYLYGDCTEIHFLVLVLVIQTNFDQNVAIVGCGDLELKDWGLKFGGLGNL